MFDFAYNNGTNECKSLEKKYQGLSDKIFSTLINDHRTYLQ